MSVNVEPPVTLTNGPHLIYFADPMCSWCWGFAPVITAIEQHFGAALPIRLVLGGLRPGTTEPLTDARRDSLRTHWHHVHEASGQTFSDAFFDRVGFIYDTDPASRAVVILRRRSMHLALAALHRLQQAFYAENQDITRPEVLGAIAAELGVPAEEFLDQLGAEAARQETWQDYALSQRTGITGFPTLIAGTGASQEYAMVTQGFDQAARLLPALNRWLTTQTKQPNSGVGANR